jgi:CspA family cold shock protein
MPSGKVKFYDEARGFGFITGDDGEQVFLPAKALGQGVIPRQGSAIEFSVVDGNRGPAALSAIVKDPLPSAVKAKRPAPSEMAKIVEDLIKVLDRIGDGLKHGKYPEGHSASKVSSVLRVVADQLDA